jgi:hypothetical protein
LKQPWALGRNRFAVKPQLNSLQIPKSQDQSTTIY